MSKENTAFDSELFANEKRRCYFGYADMDNVISSETKLKYPVSLAVLFDFPKCGISKVVSKGKNIYHRSSRFMWEEQTFLIREL